MFAPELRVHSACHLAECIPPNSRRVSLLRPCGEYLSSSVDGMVQPVDGHQDPGPTAPDGAPDSQHDGPRRADMDSPEVPVFQPGDVVQVVGLEDERDLRSYGAALVASAWLLALALHYRAV